MSPLFFAIISYLCICRILADNHQQCRRAEGSQTSDSSFYSKRDHQEKENTVIHSARLFLHYSPNNYIFNRENDSSVGLHSFRPDNLVISPY